MPAPEKLRQTQSTYYVNISGLDTPFKEEKAVRITDVSHEVFQNMIKYIYNMQPKWKDLDTRTMCSLYYLGDKYNIGCLRDDIFTNISGIEITRENLLKRTVTIILLSESLYRITTDFLKAECRGKLDRASDFCLEAETFEIEFNPLAFLKIMARRSVGPPEKCENCQQVECQDGVDVRDNFITGARIKAYLRGVLVCCSVSTMPVIGLLQRTSTM